MKKLIVVLISMSVLIFSNFAMASVHGMWNMDTIEKRSLNIGKAKPIIAFENFSDASVFKDDGTFELKENASSETPLFMGSWSQKGSNFKVDINSEQIRIFSSRVASRSAMRKARRIAWLVHTPTSLTASRSKKHSNYASNLNG